MDTAKLVEFLDQHRRIFVLTGAGCSTDSGIPDYRDLEGAWKRPPPVNFDAFVGSRSVRQRYWARSLVGWRHFGRARANEAHRALAQLEQANRTIGLVTQNVDGLHQAAGSTQVVDLHGRLDRVACLRCEQRLPRATFQHWLEDRNPSWVAATARMAPDGDADLEGDFGDFQVPECPICGGVLKPDVVFFGEHVPRSRVVQARSWLAQADAVLVVGSSLMLLSGYRFARDAAAQGLPVVAVNYGRTRADHLLRFKVQAACAEVLPAAVEQTVGAQELQP